MSHPVHGPRMRLGWFVFAALLFAPLGAPSGGAAPVKCGSAQGGSLVDAGNDFHLNETSRTDCMDAGGSTHSVHRVDAETNSTTPVGRHHVAYVVESDTNRYATTSVCPGGGEWRACSKVSLYADGYGVDSMYGQPADAPSTCTYSVDVTRPTGRASFESPNHGVCYDWHPLLL